MEGKSGPDQAGLVYRAANAIFEHIGAAPENIDFTVQLEMVELYMERVKDLFNPRKADLEIREDPKDKTARISGATRHFVVSAEEVVQRLHEGQANRTTAAT